MSDLELIRQKLRSFGFFPEFSTKSKYLAKIRSVLGLKQANDLLNSIDTILANSEDAENDIAKLIGGNTELLKIVYSTGIEISAYIFNSMLKILDTINVEPKVITDLGGANGWSLQLLEEYFELNSQLILIEKNSNWDIVISKIKVLNTDYSEINEKVNSELTISIFGITASHPLSLLQCAATIMAKDSYLLIALRIPDNHTFKLFQEVAIDLGLGISNEHSRRVRYDNKSAYFVETFPVLLLSNAINQSEIYKLEDIKFD